MIFKRRPPSGQPPSGNSALAGGRKGPFVEHYVFGAMAIDGVAYRDDVKIVNGEASADWWRRSGHLAEAGDIADMIQSKPEVIVLGSGSSGMMRVDDTIRRAAEREGFELVVLPTREAVHVYNELCARGRKVAAGFHLTC